MPTSGKYIWQGTGKCFFLPTVAGTTPTRPEIAAGTDLTASKRLAGMSGWDTSVANVDIPDASSRYVGNIPGLKTSADSSLDFYSDLANVDAIKAALAEGVAGFILFMDAGDVPGNKMDLFPVRVSALGKDRKLGNESMRFVSRFSITEEPRVELTIPA